MNGHPSDPASLAVVAIVRDEERCIARMLDSVQAVADEIVVVDTGSVDRTPRIAADHGARVLTHPWSSDFAEARNWALDHTRSYWRLIVDADEWLAEGAAALRAFAAGPPERVGLLEVLSSSESDGAAISRTDLSERLLPGDVRYRGAIHEQPVHALPVVPIAAALAHDGYEAAQREHKAERNESMLRAALDRRDDLYLRYQLGKELQAQGRHAEAAACYAAVLPQSKEAPWRHSLVARAVAVYGASGRFADLLALLDDELPRWHDSADVAFAAAGALLDLAVALPDQADELLPEIERLWQRCLRIGEHTPYPGSVPARGGHLAAGNLALLYDSLGEEKRAAEFHELHRQLQKGTR
ncbi:Glycosyl transferase family 2 [Austwickia chelonae]|uniref:Glycosyltransferase 2-like domain-containing protein n=1 Tax=Austwickia chelonae NBRC 105200 TaxID=1184607 RepID=K6VRR9_9MICO|nr:glycosyltransferase [Austwickia chelonae]GAB79454.1 hypothetical protein AUCHE_26_00050 [Austwickia chelonae NBRC 105200]SEV88153.1 Glycosyl transferase family 2 [Austwickia chelonae]